MSATATKMWDAVDYDKNVLNPSQSTATVYYRVLGTDDDVTALMTAEAAADATFEGLPRRGATVDERIAEKAWKIAVKYGYASGGGSSGSSSSSDPQYSFDVSAGTRRIVRSYGQVVKYPSSAPDSLGINDGEGVDVTCPVCTIAETHFLSASTVTAAWRKAAAQMVGCINGRSFRTYAAHELLFTGCSGTQTGGSSSDWQVTFRFAVQRNQTGLHIGNFTYSKDGWDIAWFRYKEAEQTISNKKIIVRTPVAMYVERVYPEADFEDLGI